MKIIGWWSGGVTSAIACKIAIDLYSIEQCRLIMIDTGNEDDDTYRFKQDCESLYHKKIEIIRNPKYDCIQDVWYKFRSLNVANGAICSSELKREVRKEWQTRNTYDHQVFGFDIDEPKRAKGLMINYPQSRPIYPLLFHALSKKACIERLGDYGIEIPATYRYGFRNNNCFKTGCVQGGIEYWQKIQTDFPEKFEAMANIEHELTTLKGFPITILKDQSKQAITSGVFQVFLKKNKNWPNLKCIDDMPRCVVEPLLECNGLCGINDLSSKEDIIEYEANNNLF